MSADATLGVPYNIASYALLLMMVAQCVGMEARDLVMNFGDAHIYSGHMENLRTQLERKPLELPKMVLDSSITEIDDFTYESFKLVGYQSHDKLSFDVVV